MMANYDNIILAAAKQYNVDPALIRGVIATESTNNPKAVSDKGATGLMQIMPANYKALGITDPTDPTQNIMGGAKLLSQLLDSSPDVTTALKRYQGGEDQSRWGPVNAAYPGKVLAAAGLGQQAPATLPGIPTSAPTNQSDDAIFASFTKGAQPAAQQSGPQSDDAIFAAMTKTAPAAAASAPAPAQMPATQGQAPGMLASFGAGVGRGVQETALGAQQLLGHGAQAIGLDNIGNWLVNDVNQGLTRGAQEVAPFSAAHPVLTEAGKIGGSMAATAPLVMAAPATTTLAGTVGQGIGMGALMGGLAPVNPDSQNFAEDKLRQMGIGALLGGATPAAIAGAAGAGRYVGNALGSIARPFTQGGRQQIAQNIVAQAARGGPTNLDLSQIVPGSTPTLAEATGNPGIATLQRTIRDIIPNPFVAQEQQNAAARLSQLQNALGTPQELEAAQAASRQIAGDLGGAVATNGVGPSPVLNSILSRPAMAPIVKDAEKAAINSTGTNPFQAARDALSAQRVAQFQSIAGSPQALEAAKDARETLANALYSQANAERFTPDSTLNALLNRPSMQQAVARAQKLASETGQPLKIGVDLPSQTTPSTILNAQGQPAFSVTTPAQQSSFSGRALNYIKMGLDDLISSGSQTGGIIGHEKSALNSTKGDLLNWMDSQSPIYQQARQTYAQMSEPINSMETLQGLNLTDASGAIVPSKLDSAIKGIQSAQAERGINAAKSVTAQQLNSLSALRDSVNADRSAPIPSNLGPAAIGHIQTAITSTLNSGKALAPETQTALEQAQTEILNTLKQQNPQAIGSRSAIPGTAAGNFVGPVTLPQQAEMQARSAQSLQLLQGMNLTDASGNVTLAKVQNALKSLQKQGLQADPEKMAALVSVRDDLMRASNTGLGRSAGSATAQNLATQQMMRSVLPGKLGALAGQLPTGTVGGALGGLAGYGVAGAPGAAVGGAIGARVGSGLSALMNTHNEAIQNEVARLMLNPSAVAPTLNSAASRSLPFAASPGLQRLLYPAIVNGGVRSLGDNRRP
jgi:hypothetical protein